MNELLPLISYCFVMSSTPGPNNVMLATSGANFGYRQVLPTILGIQAGVFVQTILTCLGLGAVFVAFPILHQILRVTGALYLIFLAWKITGTTMSAEHEPKAVSFTQAALFQGLNPKSWVKAVTLASVFMPVGYSPVTAAFLVAVISLMVGTPCSMMWALFGYAIRRLLDDPFKRRIFNFLMGATLIILAVKFLT